MAWMPYRNYFKKSKSLSQAKEVKSPDKAKSDCKVTNH